MLVLVRNIRFDLNFLQVSSQIVLEPEIHIHLSNYIMPLYNLSLDVIDMQLQELNRRFDEVNTELLLCVACLSPKDSFSAFDKKKLVKMAEFYPYVHGDDRFSNLNGIGELSKRMVEVEKHNIYSLVYLLLKLALILPVATTTVERAFSAMKLIKTYIEKDVFNSVTNDVIIQYFQDIKTRRG
ncbi:uncharacterized protein LOC126657636 [Mercurialis annua]|uniref:uncharacterized protein LOC126657636 n=1 Tax=Mercurialis annua TaxID=3986 RepID=UPI002160D513|nr:uncharacterized protein LOC126657636 [Mercurialis annua]